MQCTSWNMIWITLLFFIAVLPVNVISGQTGDPLQSQSHSTKPIQSPLIEEMTICDRAFGSIVTAVAIGNSDGIHKAIETTHSTIEKIRVGVQTGAVTLPKNTLRVKDFLELDQKFQDKLDALDRAARHNNQREMLRITNMLLSTCVKCHQTFRK